MARAIAGPWHISCPTTAGGGHRSHSAVRRKVMNGLCGGPLMKISRSAQNKSDVRPNNPRYVPEAQLRFIDSIRDPGLAAWLGVPL